MKNLVYAGFGAYNRVEDLGRTVQSGDPVIDKAGKAAVALTASADATGSVTQDGITISGFPIGGVGLKEQEVTLAFDVTAEFLASGFDGTVPTVSALTQGQAINYKTSNNKLTTAAVASGIVAYGTVDFTPDYDKTRGYVPVKIGA